MGLGTKIKEALSGDKKSQGGQLRKTPGAYPESTVDVPRTTGTWETSRPGAWETSRSNSKKKSVPVVPAKEERIAENDELDDDYTYTPVAEVPPKTTGEALTKDDDDDVLPSPDSRLETNHARTASKDHAVMSPYWGNVGKADTRPPVPEKLPETPVKEATPVEANGHHTDLSRNGTVNSTNYSPIRANAADRGYNDDKFDGPIGSVNRGQARLINDDAARAQSMAASESLISQPTMYGEDEPLPSGLGHSTTAYGHGAYNGHARTNTYDENTAYGASPTANHTALPNHYDANGYDANNYGANGYNSKQNTPNKHFDVTPAHHAVNDVNGINGVNGVNGVGNSRSNTYDNDYGMQRTPTVTKSPVTNARGTFGSPQQERYTNSPTNFQPNLPQQQTTTNSSPSGSMDNTNTRTSSSDHYGPGHQGAKVLHRCQHCGNDNDITKYFSRDVVYRLS